MMNNSRNALVAHQGVRHDPCYPAIFHADLCEAFLVFPAWSLRPATSRGTCADDLLRANADDSPSTLILEYYRQRASNGGLIITESTHVSDDSRGVAAVKRVLAMQDGPTALVGHSYGGVLITQAGTDPKVVSLVYLAAMAPDEGEVAGQLLQKIPPASTAVTPTADGFLYLDPARFRADFAAGLPVELTRFMALSQVMTKSVAFGTKVTNPAWRTKPSWGIVATKDRAINPELERDKRARDRQRSRCFSQFLLPVHFLPRDLHLSVLTELIRSRVGPNRPKGGLCNWAGKGTRCGGGKHRCAC